jgi:hypothetical protein
MVRRSERRLVIYITEACLFSCNFKLPYNFPLLLSFIYTNSRFLYIEIAGNNVVILFSLLARIQLQTNQLYKCATQQLLII